MASDSDDLSQTEVKSLPGNNFMKEPYHLSSSSTMYERDTDGPLNRSFDSHYTEEINIKMRIPEKLTVGQAGVNSELSRLSKEESWYPMANGDYLSCNMEVPSRIVVSVGEEGRVKYGESRKMFSEDAVQLTDPVSLKTPPRKITLADRNLDALAIDERSEPENSQRIPHTQHQLAKHAALDGSLSNSMLEKNSLLSHIDAEDVDDFTLLRRQVFLLHRRVQSLEKRVSEKSNRDVYLYALNAAFWVLTGWLFYNRRSY